jgi:hypothetical protein
MMSDSRRTRIAFYLVVFMVLYLYVPSCASGGLSQALGLVQNNYPGFYLPTGINPDSLMQQFQQLQDIAQPMELPDLEDIPEDIEDNEALDTGSISQSKRRRTRRSRQQEDAGYDSGAQIEQESREDGFLGPEEKEANEEDPERRFIPSPTPRIRRDPLGYRLPKPYDYGERNPYRYDDTQIHDPNNPNPYPMPTYPYLERYYRELEMGRQDSEESP